MPRAAWWPATGSLALKLVCAASHLCPSHQLADTLRQPVYNKWHETELERWLSDHSIPYPAPADRKDLESLVEKNWDSYAVQPYNSWDTAELSAYLQAKGKDTKDSVVGTKDSLLSQVKTNWYETEETAHGAWASVGDWILDTWSESQLKAFADKHGIPGM